MEKLASLCVLLLVVAATAFVYARLARRLSSVVAVWLVAAASVAASALAIWLVDVNVPLADSHWRPQGGPVPLVLVLLAQSARVASFCALAFLPPRYRALRGSAPAHSPRR